MFQIISVIIAIALFAWLMLAGIGYFNPDAITREGEVAKLRLAVSGYQAGLVAYQYANGKRAAALGDITPSLVPASTLPTGFTVASYDRPSHALCFAGAALSESAYAVAQKFVAEQPSSGAWISGTCFQTAAATGWVAPTAFPASVSLTVSLGGL